MTRIILYLITHIILNPITEITHFFGGPEFKFMALSGRTLTDLPVIDYETVFNQLSLSFAFLMFTLRVDLKTSVQHTAHCLG